MNEMQEKLRQAKEQMQGIGRAVHERIPEGFGFFVMVFPFGGPDEGRANYVSNGQRKDIINAMKEFIIRCGYEEDWLKNLEP